MKSKKIIYLGTLIFLVAVLVVSYFIFFNSSWKFTEDRPIKILWINSYHGDFFWSEAQIKGFRDSLDESGVDYEINDFHLNVILNKSEESWIKNSEEVKEFIDFWKPDLVYATDDQAQEYVASDHIGSDILWVFSGVNAEEEDYNFQDADNVVGIFERKPVIQTFNLLEQIDPSVKKVTIIGDPSLTTRQISKEIEFALEKSSQIELVNWFEDVEYYSDLKQKFDQANEDSDFVLFLSPERIKYDDQSGIVPMSEILKWRVENNHIPEISLWTSFTEAGGLLSVEVSPYNQGYGAGELVKQILIKGRKPGKIESYAPIEGDKSINLARARQLGLDISSVILINSDVYENFPWEEKNEETD